MPITMAATTNNKFHKTGGRDAKYLLNCSNIQEFAALKFQDYATERVDVLT